MADLYERRMIGSARWELITPGLLVLGLGGPGREAQLAVDAIDTGRTWRTAIAEYRRKPA